MTALGALTGVLVLVGAALTIRTRAARRCARTRVRGRPPDGADRRTHRAPPEDPTATYPDVVDLLAVAAASGLPAAPAVAAVTPRVPPPWRAAFAACRARAEAGDLFTDALDAVVAGDAGVGDVARPLVAALRAGLADGDRLAADLLRVAVDGRDLRRRRAEEQARRIPVRLLLPLVTCSLPAFAVLSIVPIVAGTLDGLRLPSVTP